MCGIAGFFASDPRICVAIEPLKAMARSLRHRGPDEKGLRSGPGYGLAHRRLAIVDIVDGHQPMSDISGQIWVTYNGEIYNHGELRVELESLGHRFATRCDTEVLVNGYREWGTTLPRKLRGMFAFAIVDERTHTLFAARDRVGKKPFYYTRIGSDLLFASELKAILQWSEISRELDPEAVARYFSLRYIPDPSTIFRGIHRLPPGSTLELYLGDLRISQYWRYPCENSSDLDGDELADQVLATLDEATSIRLMGEVPLGAFLSGGVDSYAVVESMSRSSPTPVQACSVGFLDSPLDEREYARQAAKSCGVQLRESAISPADMLDQLWFADTFDEPFSDGSAVPTYRVCQIARQHVTVALSGDGGDESFAGYRRYKYDRIENRVRSLLPAKLWGGLGAVYPKADYLPRWLRFQRTLANLACGPPEAYARSVSASLPEETAEILRPRFRLPPEQVFLPITSAYATAPTDDPLKKAIAADFATWLPGDILTKVDRTSMAVSLEVRAPLLDHKLIEIAAGIPSGLLLRQGVSKGFFRWTLADRLGEGALQRPKQGFHVPLRLWLAGPLGQALETALVDEFLGEIVRPEPVLKMLSLHRKGLRDSSELLWSVLVFHRFLKRWVV